MTMRDRYQVKPTPSGWQVLRVSRDGATSDDFLSVIHRRRQVADAYAAASEALEAYLASLDARCDSAELFECWRELDDRYETLATEGGDPPINAGAAGPGPTWRDDRRATLH